jgi:dipeptidyl aminopeptidase/acylaminoacyl peptidase
LAGAGYGVLMIDFHGSTGYGQAFVESIMRDRGGKTLTDQKLGLAAALAKYRWIDGQRICAIGGSFGGYMVNWIAGAWPTRFRCLVNHDGMFDNRMKYFTSDYIGYLEEGFGGTYFDNPAGHESFNPATLVDKWQTPMLVIHGGRDYRVPETHGIATFTALQRKGVPSRFLYFPDESHWVLKPANSLQWHRELVAWLDRWLQDDKEKESTE